MQYFGLKKQIPYTQGGLGWITLDGDFRNNVESAKNRYTDNREICFARYGDGRGFLFALFPGWNSDNFGQYKNVPRAFKVTAPGGRCP